MSKFPSNTSFARQWKMKISFVFHWKKRKKQYLHLWEWAHMWQEKLSEIDVPFDWCYSFVCHAHVLAVIILIIPTDVWSLYFVATNRSNYKVMKMKIKFDANERMKTVSPEQHTSNWSKIHLHSNFIRFASSSRSSHILCRCRCRDAQPVHWLIVATVGAPALQSAHIFRRLVKCWHFTAKA